MNYQIYRVPSRGETFPVADISDEDIAIPVPGSYAGLSAEDYTALIDSAFFQQFTRALAKALSGTRYDSAYILDVRELWLDENSFSKHYMMMKINSPTPLDDDELMRIFYAIASRYFGEDGQRIFGGSDEQSYYELGFSLD